MQLVANDFETQDIETVDAALAALAGESELAAVLQTIVRAVREGLDVSILEKDKELTPAQVADMLQVSRPHVMHLIERGELRSIVVGSRNNHIPQSEVMAFIGRKAQASRDVAAALARRDSAKRALIARAAGVDPEIARQLGY